MKKTLRFFLLTWMAASWLSGAESGAEAASAPDPTRPAGGPRVYEVEELTPIVNLALKGNRDFANGEKLFNTNCRLCHLFGGGAGGIGPDLSGVGGRFGVDGLLQSIIEPSFIVSDLYDRKRVTKTDGTEVVGRLIGQDLNSVTLVAGFAVNPDTLTAYWPTTNPIKIKSDEVQNMEDSGESIMPPGIINGMKEADVADLIAYLISNGNPGNNVYKPFPAGSPAGSAKSDPADPAKK